MFAVIEYHGSQYCVQVNSKICIKGLFFNVGSIKVFDKILILNERIGTPYLNGVKVFSEVIDCIKDKKIIVFKKKRRHNYRRKFGYSNFVSTFRILRFSLSIN